MPSSCTSFYRVQYICRAAGFFCCRLSLCHALMHHAHYWLHLQYLADTTAMSRELRRVEGARLVQEAKAAEQAAREQVNDGHACSNALVSRLSLTHDAR